MNPADRNDAIARRASHLTDENRAAWESRFQEMADEMAAKALGYSSAEQLESMTEIDEISTMDLKGMVRSQVSRMTPKLVDLTGRWARRDHAQLTEDDAAKLGRVLRLSHAALEVTGDQLAAVRSAIAPPSHDDETGHEHDLGGEG